MSIELKESASLRWYETPEWSVFIDEQGVPVGFEHARLGEEGGTGGLWFDGTHLVDYDGVYNLPQGVIAICEAKGFNMDYAKDDNYEEMKSYRVFVTVYHSFTVEATSEEHARQEASDVIWDDHIKDCQIDVEEDDDE